MEPLESQAIQRSREVALPQSQVVDSRPPASPSPKAEPSRQSSMRRKRSNRVSKSSSSATSSRPGTLRRRSSAGAEHMEPSGYGQPSASPTGSSSNSTTMRPLPRGLEAGPSIRYTPVTGRISRAKKGQPVHICDLCEVPRVRDLLLHHSNMLTSIAFHKSGALAVRIIGLRRRILLMIRQTSSIEPSTSQISLHLSRLRESIS